MNEEVTIELRVVLECRFHCGEEAVKPKSKNRKKNGRLWVEMLMRSIREQKESLRQQTTVLLAPSLPTLLALVWGAGGSSSCSKTGVLNPAPWLVPFVKSTILVRGQNIPPSRSVPV